jgi:hypothetical protein
MVMVRAEFEALRAGAAKRARKVGQLAEVGAIMCGGRCGGAKEVAERRVARRCRHLQAVKQPARHRPSPEVIEGRAVLLSPRGTI